MTPANGKGSYTYDATGNITEIKTVKDSTTTTKTLEYDTSSGWKDRLMKVDGKSLVYSSSAPGLPTTYQNGRTYTLAWNGNCGELTSATVGGTTTTFSYFYGGLRRTKTSGGVTKNYYYDGSRLIAEKWSTGAYLLYHYDENGSIYAVTHSATGSGYAKYYLLKNLQGDVVQILNSTNGVVANYEYDAWGNVVSATDANGNAVANFALINPIRYRGYYYDSETGFYYLKSRYYDPANFRFISADTRLDLNSGATNLNLFAYCGNDPVNRVDPKGELWGLIPLIIIPLIFTACSSKSISDVGAASPYSPSNSVDYNCYAYALGEDQNKYVGGSPSSVKDFSVNNVAKMVLNDADKDGRTMRIIDNYDSPIESNEYRIALRTGKEDYHFMVQHNDGSWSHKPGFCSTRLIDGANPSEISWDAPIVDSFLLYNFGIVKEIGFEPNYYNSRTIYFAVSK